MTKDQRFFATCPKGVGDLLRDELLSLGIDAAGETPGGVPFESDLQHAYRACLWSRVASRILMQLKTFEADDYEQLYDQVRSIRWDEHLNVDDSFAIDCFSSHQVMNNDHFAMLKIKDAIVDQFTEETGQRPDVERDRASIRINAYLSDKECIIYLDLSGEPLHKRGYRMKTGKATLKENLAAAIVLRTRWRTCASEGKALVDPMCGTGTLLIEAAWLAAGIAPGILRDYFGFLGWKQHDQEIWQDIHREASEDMEERITSLPVIIGMDSSMQAYEAASANIEAAMLSDAINLSRADAIDTVPAAVRDGAPGMVITNPPYGERLGDVRTLSTLYHRLGELFKKHYPGWEVNLFTSSHDLMRKLGLRAHHKNTLYNGALKCVLYRFSIGDQRKDAVSDAEVHENAAMFANRLAKNLKHIRKWARRNDVSCYRVYDADIPQYAVAIDVYGDKVHVQEYEAPDTVNEVVAYQRLTDIMQVIATTMDVGIEDTVLKTRRVQKGSEQYTKLEEGEKRSRVDIVTENGLRFEVNLYDYLDTGLFIDHRGTRALVRDLSAGKRFLNLFAYTGSVTVYAAAGGARSTTTVDMSNTYIEWAERNLKLNKFTGRQHRFVRGDVTQWLWDEKRAGGVYDLIFLDPPTFSNSKKMQKSFDVKRDHAELIGLTLRLLSKDGILIFSTNARKFRLDEEALEQYSIREITTRTTTEDFKRKPAHRCWMIAKNEASIKRATH